jgi:hypothetical protein
MADRTVPVDWPGLLAWSVKFQDATTNPETAEAVKAMSQEDIDFLAAAMDSCIMDQTQRIRTLIEVLRLPEDGALLWDKVHRYKHALRALDDKKNLKSVLQVREAKAARVGEDADEPAPAAAAAVPAATPADLTALEERVAAEKAEALEELEELCWKVDRSNGFVALKGLIPLQQTLKSRYPHVRALSAALVATLVQNNAQAQSAVCDSNILQTLLSLLVFEDETAVASQFAFKFVSKLITIDLSATTAPRTLAGYKVVRMALYAISSLLSNHVQAQVLFLSSSGLPHVFRLLAARPHAAETAAGGLSDWERVRDCATALRRRAAGVLLSLLDADVTVGSSVAENVQRFCLTQAAQRDEKTYMETSTATLASASAAVAEGDAGVSNGALVEVPDATAGPAYSHAAGASAAEAGPDMRVHPAWDKDVYRAGADALGAVRVSLIVAEVMLLTVGATTWEPLVSTGDRGTVDEIRKIVRAVGSQGKRYDSYARELAGALLHSAEEPKGDEEEDE